MLPNTVVREYENTVRELKIEVSWSQNILEGAREAEQSPCDKLDTIAKL